MSRQGTTGTPRLPLELELANEPGVANPASPSWPTDGRFRHRRSLSPRLADHIFSSAGGGPVRTSNPAG